MRYISPKFTYVSLTIRIRKGLRDLRDSLDKTSELMKTLDRQASEIRLTSLVQQILILKGL